MPQNSIRRAFIQSVALLAEKQLTEAIITSHTDDAIQCNIIEKLPNFFDNITDAEIEAQFKICIQTDPYCIDNGLPLPYFKTAFNLDPPRQYNADDVAEFLYNTFHDKCTEMRTGKWTTSKWTAPSILPAIIAKEVYRLFNPCTARINPRTGLPIQKESNAHRKQLNVFESRYFNVYLDSI